MQGFNKENKNIGPLVIEYLLSETEIGDTNHAIIHYIKNQKLSSTHKIKTI